MPTVREDNDKLNGIIFRLYDSKPGDRVVHLLASDGSRHVLIAKGVKKGTSRKAHAIDLLNYVQVKVSGKGDMPLITDIKLIDKFEGFKSSYKGLIFVQLICEVLHIFILEKQEEVGYFKIFLTY
jgi:DNA repair protein RecO